jgi:hypothetical protein
MEKQEKIETVEEAALNYSIYNEQINTAIQESVKFGAKWQAERMYTEDDMRMAYSYGMFAVTTGRNFKDWFINYKNK